MGARDYQILIMPYKNSPLRPQSPKKIKIEEAIEAVVAELQNRWSSIHFDSIEPAAAPAKSLVYETDEYIFQLLITPSFDQSYIYISVRFAYCNTRSIYNPIFEVIEWLMKYYQMYCSPMRKMIPPSDGQPTSPVAISDSNKLRSLLVPSMDYNRMLWQQWVGSAEEVKLRPSETREYFKTKP